MSKTVAILQPNYIPWRGYFDLMSRVDEFIVYDDTQYTRRDWRNRNKIMLGGKETWLSIPVDASGKYDQLIRDVAIADPKWQTQHPKSLHHAYGKAPYFRDLMDVLSPLYAAAPYKWLMDADVAFLEAINDYLGLTTRITLASDYKTDGAKTQKLLSLCRAAGATHYLSGPAAKAYMEPALFAAAGITLRYITYPTYPAYDHVSTYAQAMSIVDSIAHCGPHAAAHFSPPKNKVAA